MRRLFSPGVLTVTGIALLVVVGVLAVAGGTFGSGYYLLLPDRAHPLAPLVHIPGGRAPRDGGDIYYVDVFERKASLLERLLPSFRDSGADLVPSSVIIPSGLSEQAQRAEDNRQMRESQQVAAAVALRALGYPVVEQAIGVRVVAVYAGTNALGRLEQGDLIVGVDGKGVRTIAQLHMIVDRHKIGDVVRVLIRRAARTLTLSIRTIRDPLQPHRPLLGLLPSNAVRVGRLPVRVQFDLGNVGGPSAGLAFALEVLEQRGRDVDHGYKVAATGTIEPDGSVGPIGGVKQKTIGARAAHVDVFLVPTGDNAVEARKYAHGLRLIPVGTFQQALHVLTTLPPKR